MSRTLCPCGHEQYSYRLIDRDGARILTKNVERSQHWLRKMNAWAIQMNVIAEHAGSVDLLEVNDIETGIRFQITPHMAELSGTQIFMGDQYGVQLAIPLPFWTRSASDTYQMVMF